METRNFGREITSAWALPCHQACARGPAHLTADDCLAIIYPNPAKPFAEITLQIDGTPLARTRHYTDTAAALNALEPIYQNIETVE